MFTEQSNDLFQTSVDRGEVRLELNENELVNQYQLEDCVKWIEVNKYERTCLQFPEELLNDGVSIALYLQKETGKFVYILGDTSYGSCCVDEVAAEHVKGDSIIHFGHACLSPVLKLPVFYVFLKDDLNLENLCHKFELLSKDTLLIIFYDDVYHHLYLELCDAFKEKKNVCISKLNINHETFDGVSKTKVLCGRIFTVEPDVNVTAVYIGDESVTLENLVLNLPEFKWYQYRKKEQELLEYKINRNKFLMKRVSLIEKIKEAKIIGILIGTLGIKNYLEAIERIKLLVKKSGKKCYKLAVGKLNVPKLANFPEIDVFVCISCQENPILKDFKGYYKPVVSLFEIEMALSDRPYSMEYTSDFRELLPGGSFYKKSDVENELNQFSNSSETSQDLTKRNEGTLIESSGFQYLMNRTWRGLEQRIGETEVSKAVKGRSGIPQTYENELTVLSSENPS